MRTYTLFADRVGSLVRIMRVWSLLIAILTLGKVVAQDIEPKITQLLQEQGLSGAVYTLVDSDSISYFGSGLKNVKTGEKLHRDDKVHVGSITKTVLAIGVLRLATEGRLHIDDPIEKYMPHLPIRNPWADSHAVTIRHLLDHTSGLGDIRLWHFFSTSCNPDTPLQEFYARTPEVLRIQTKPGTIFSYSNMGYTILGILIEAIVHEPYEDYLDRSVLKPIGLKHSTFHFVSQSKDRTLSMGHFEDGSIAPAMPIYVRPAGQFTTTAHDMGILLRFMLHRGRLGSDAFIRQEFMDMFGVPTQTIAAKYGLKHGYAFGAVSRDRHGVVGIAHSGNTIGFRAMYYLFPEHNKAFFIAHNMDSEQADYEVFNKVLINKLLPMRTVGRRYPNKPFSRVETTKWDGYYVPVVTRIEPMGLLDMLTKYVQVTYTPEGLVLTPFQKQGLVLTTADNRLFRTIDKVDASHLFYVDAYGQHYLSTGIQTWQKVKGWQIGGVIIRCFLGSVACLIVLFLGSYRVLKPQSRGRRTPILYCFLGLLLVLVSGILLSMNELTQIGDRNVSTCMVYFSTLTLPVATCMSLFAYAKKLGTGIKSLGFWAVLLVAQFVLLLWEYGLIPLATWR
ncbi:serine hydrolase domain-containing protein [Sphingobacterium suaedae]|uniref:Serine hydrolase domain-containing protein n=1 Tax=Sphingobacterium suaedae TaxID=1686402 RepID=A0ABW5KPP6_9SPHI